MKPPSFIGLLFALTSLVGALLALGFSPKLIEEVDGTIAITINGRLTIGLICLSISGFLFTTFFESYQGQRIISIATKDMAEHSIIIERQYDEISKLFMVYPSLKTLINDHYDFLRQLYAISEKYLSRPEIKNIFDQYVKFWFNNFIDKDISVCINQLTNFTLSLENQPPQVIRTFIHSFWQMAKPNGSIKATSIVSPPPGGTFWNKPEAYLRAQRALVVERGVKIYRYFIFTDNHSDRLDEHIETLELNHQNAILTRVVLFENKESAGACYQDIGIVDNIMGVENEVAENGEPTKSTFCVQCSRHEQKIESIKGIFGFLEENPNTFEIEEYVTLDEFVKDVKEKIRALNYTS